MVESKEKAPVQRIQSERRGRGLPEKRPASISPKKEGQPQEKKGQPADPPACRENTLTLDGALRQAQNARESLTIQAGLTPEQRNRSYQDYLEAVLNIVDALISGKVPVSEMKKVSEALGIPQEKLQGLVGRSRQEVLQEYADQIFGRGMQAGQRTRPTAGGPSPDMAVKLEEFERQRAAIDDLSRRFNVGIQEVQDAFSRAQNLANQPANIGKLQEEIEILKRFHDLLPNEDERRLVAEAIDLFQRRAGILKDLATSEAALPARRRRGSDIETIEDLEWGVGGRYRWEEEYKKILLLTVNHRALREYLRDQGISPSDPPEILQKKLEDHFYRQVRKLYNRLFRSADSTPHLPFDHAFSVFVEEAEYKAMIDLLEGMIESFAREYGAEGWDIQALRAHTWGWAQMERRNREYLHNVAYIWRMRGGIENLSKYAESFTTVNLDASFYRDEVVQAACQIYDEVVEQELAGNNWVISPTLFQENPQRLGTYPIREEVEKRLRAYFLAREGREIEHWELKRAVAVAEGIGLGVTMTLAEKLARADAPGYQSYFGEAILKYLNMRHFFKRWGQPSQFFELMYAWVVRRGFFGPFSHAQWERERKKIGSLLARMGDELDLSRLRQEYAALGGSGEILRFIDFLNLFKIGGLFTRGGWRFQKTLDRFNEQEKDERGNPIPGLLDCEATWSRLIDEVGLGAAQVRFEELAQKRAAQAIGWWDKKTGFQRMDEYLHHRRLTGVENRRFEDEVRKQKKILLKRFFTTMLERMPAKFLMMELLYEFGGKFKASLRWRILTRAFPGMTEDQLKEQAKRLERNLTLVQRKVMQEIIEERRRSGNPRIPRREIRAEDFESLPESERADTLRYWREIRTVAAEEGSVDRFVESYLARTPRGKGFTDRTFEYFIGVEDFDFSQIDFRQAGEAVIARSLGDANTASKAIDLLFNLDKNILQAAATHGFKPLIEPLQQIFYTVKSYGGVEPASEVVRNIAVMIARYFDESLFMRVPVLSVLGKIFPRLASLSKAVGGTRAWSWDPDTKGEFFDLLQVSLGMARERVIKMKQEVGAIDANRWIFMLMKGFFWMFLLQIIAAMKTSLEEEQKKK